MNFEALPWKDYITMGAAALGAGLGVMNTWNAMSQRRVRLRVKPAYVNPGGVVGFCIEVVNLSMFPVTIAEVGFSLRGRKRLAVISPEFNDGKPWPRRLESRDAVTAYFDPAQIAQHRQRIGKAYARTSCGELGYGTSPALRQLRNLIVSQ